MGKRVIKITSGFWTIALLCASEAAAQGVDPQHFHPTLTPRGGVVTEAAAAEGDWDVTVQLVVDYANEPLVAASHGRRLAALVRDRLGATVSLDIGFGFADWLLLHGLELGVALPIIAYQTGEQLDAQGRADRAPDAMGLGDPRLLLRLQILAQETQLVDLALVPVLTLPFATGGDYFGAGPASYENPDGSPRDFTSEPGDFFGAQSVGVIPTVALGRDLGPLRVVVNLGYVARSLGQVSNFAVGSELLWRGGAGLDFEALGAGVPTILFAEAFGATSADAPFSKRSATPIEALVSARSALGDFLLTLGGGWGASRGYGAPRFRVVAGVAWAPRVHDSDHDGIFDDKDRCPDAPEDADGFEDEDGCPDPDNDGDRLADPDDACPDVAEDQDGFEDADGCPDLDDDHDGVPDASDTCAREPEDHDGFSDADGCPDIDNDQDGVLDSRDACPLQPEDKDDFQDGDGCPDPDNDQDTILDGVDKCPLQPEDMNGQKDDDGCPDAKDDRDGDGIVDKVDPCPKDPEDRDGFEDEDGCPDPDNDKDGILDGKDGCVAFAEDKDGFLDDDGCPEDDNDGDGLWDQSDKCPNEAEVVNGVEDDDGCPDEGAQLVRLTADKIEIKETVYFDTGDDVIMERSFPLLDQVAALLKNHAELKKVRVEGHTDDQGSEDYNQSLSERRAKSVQRYLVTKGVAGERLDPVGFGEARPIASNKSARGRDVNRRVEFNIAEQGPPPAPPAKPAPPVPPPPAATPAPAVRPAPASTPAPAPAPAAAPASTSPELVMHKLTMAQSLEALALALWRSAAHVDVLLAANPEVQDPKSSLPAGTVVRIPRRATHTVQKGEDLASITKSWLGKSKYYLLIVEASKDVLADPSKLDVGMVLTIPLVHPDVQKLLTPP